MIHTGKIISVEGVDAVGKLTQSKLLETWFIGKGFSTAYFSFPDYETIIGKEIHAFLSGEREYAPELRHILFAANRWEKVPEIQRQRQTKDIIITNRYTESNYVYGVANGLDLRWLEALEAGVPKSDFVLVLDASKDLLESRPGEKDKYEKNTSLQNRVRRLYRELAERFGWTMVDGSGTVDQVHRSITALVDRQLRQWGVD